MNIYKLESKDDFQKIILKDESTWISVMDQFLVGKKIVDWNPLEVVCHDKDLKMGDYPTLMPSIPTFSKRAAIRLKEILEKNGELLPLSLNQNEMFFYNVLSIIDCLNEKESEIIRFDDGRIMFVGNYVLKKMDYTKFEIFKLTKLENDCVFANDFFRDAVIKNNLKGFNFIKVGLS